jgi:AraC-like DNA-binding protein
MSGQALPHVELFTTRVLPPDRRQDFWRSLIAETFPGMVVEAPSSIQADLARWSVGRLGIARALSSRSRVSRAHESAGERMLVFHLQRRGRMMMHQRGQVEYASAGDVLIAEEDTPYDIDISDANDCLILNVPITLLGDAAARRNWCSRRLDGKDPNVRLLGRLLGGVWDERDHMHDLDRELDTVLAGLARIACLSDRAQPEVLSRGPVEFALAHLHDPGLGTASIAQATGLSPRAVQKAFVRHMGASPTGFITEQRLQRAAQMLRDHPAASVTHIAFDIGFSDPSFFARCFRRRFGKTPSQWRMQAP